MRRMHTDSDVPQGGSVGPVSYAAVEPQALLWLRESVMWLFGCQALRSRRKKMSVHEELFLNPFEKWYRYGRFPRMFFIHTALVALVTCQVMYYLQKDITHACQTACHFSSLFLGTPSGSVTLWQPGELQDVLENAVHNIFLINDVTFNDVIYTRRGLDVLREDAVESAEEEHRRLNVSLRFRNTSLLEVELTRQDFMQARGKVKKYLQETLPTLYTRSVRDLQEIFIRVHLLETVHELPVRGRFLWRMLLRFDGTDVGRFVGRLTYALDTSGGVRPGGFFGLIDKIVIFFALTSLVLLCRKMSRSARVLLRLRRAASQATTASTTRLSWKDELALFSWWWAVSAFSNFAQLLASMACLRRTTDVIERFSLLGWSCCLTWLNVCQYLEFFPGYYVTFSTTGKGMASVCRYMASVLPILTAFMFLGTCQFWQAKTFQGVSASYASLFSLLNGDMVHDAFEDLGSVGGWAGHLYLYVFIFIFIYIILNVNITIIEEAYYSAHFQGLTHEKQARADNQLSTVNVGLFSRQTSEEPEAAEQLLRGMDGQTRTTRSDANSEAAPGPNVTDAGSSSPLLQVPHEARGTPRFMVRGSLSPRILDNPRLQGALAAVFTPQPQTSFRSGQPPLVPSMPTSNRGGSLQHALTSPALSAPSIAVVPAEAAPRLPVSSRQSSEPLQGELPPGETQATSSMQWWLTELPRLTALLQSTPLPRRSEFTQESGWEQLQSLLSDHLAAVNEVSAALYMELART